jgi:hypothetical protein
MAKSSASATPGQGYSLQQQQQQEGAEGEAPDMDRRTITVDFPVSAAASPTRGTLEPRPGHPTGDATGDNQRNPLLGLELDVGSFSPAHADATAAAPSPLSGDQQEMTAISAHGNAGSVVMPGSAIAERPVLQSVRVTQYAFEAVAQNTHCPQHNRRLLRSQLEGLTCVHTDCPYYRCVECEPDAGKLQCPEPGCLYCVCDDCFDGGAVSSLLQNILSAASDLRQKGIWKAVCTIVIIAAMFLYLPVVRLAVQVVFCDATFQCEFGACWRNPTVKFLIAAFIAIVVLVIVGFGLIALELFLLRHRHNVLIGVLPLQRIQRQRDWWFLPRHTVRHADYERFLFVDDSLLRALYEAFDFVNFWHMPLLLMFKAFLVLALVGAEANSLTQLAAVSALEALYCVIESLSSPYQNVFVEIVARLSTFAMVLLLALMALHRADIAADATSEGYASQMVALTWAYWALFALVTVVAIAHPFVARYLRERSKIRELRKSELEAKEAQRAHRRDVLKKRKEEEAAKRKKQRQERKARGEPLASPVANGFSSATGIGSPMSLAMATSGQQAAASGRMLNMSMMSLSMQPSASQQPNPTAAQQ